MPFSLKTTSPRSLSICNNHYIAFSFVRKFFRFFLRGIQRSEMIYLIVHFRFLLKFLMYILNQNNYSSKLPWFITSCLPAITHALGLLLWLLYLFFRYSFTTVVTILILSSVLNAV